MRIWACFALLISLGCNGEIGVSDPGARINNERPSIAMRRLTVEQYRHSIRDLIGEEITVSDELEPDTALNGFISIGASRTTISGLGVEQYESSTYETIYQILLNPALMGTLFGCATEEDWDEACMRDTLRSFGRRAFRRPMTIEELDAYTLLAMSTASAPDSTGVTGIAYAIGALLQSPYFLFRVELGEPSAEDPTVRVYDDWEMASRLSFLLWNTTPDDELLDAAENGDLSTSQGVRNHAERMILSPRARNAVRNFFSELFELETLHDVDKDRSLYPAMSDTLMASAKEETLRVLEDLVFEQNADYRDLFDSRETFVNAELAAVYGIEAPNGDTFAKVSLPQDGQRVGLLGHVSLLALNSHDTETSPTLRGRFLRQVVLCGEIPAPPPGADTTVPPPSGSAPTMRDRVEEHATNPDCAQCHDAMDPIGLGLEMFDAVGVYRDTENSHPIDARGSLDGDPFDGPASLAVALRNHPDLATCFVRKLHRYATGRVETLSEEAEIQNLARRFEQSRFRVRRLLVEMVSSDAFRLSGEPR